jgi:hypothetical protein
MDDKTMKYNLKTAIQKAKKYDDLKSEVESIFFQDDEEVGLDVIGEKVCSMLGLYGNE